MPRDDTSRERESKRRRYSPDYDDKRSRRHREEGDDRDLDRDRDRRRDDHYKSSRRHDDYERDPRSHRDDRRSSRRDNGDEKRSRGYDYDSRSSRRYDDHSSKGRDRSPGDSHRRSRSPLRLTGPLPSQSTSFALTSGSTPPPEKAKPNFAPTGLLAKEANTVTSSRPGRDVVLKYHEPPEARKPPASQPWRLWHFQGDAKDPVDTVQLAERSCWLFGREAGIVDVRLPEGAEAQHAVVQFRHSVSRDEYGDKAERVRPYLIDLETKGGTRLNGMKIVAGRYVELRDGDVLVFGREKGEEWVVMLPPSEGN